MRYQSGNLPTAARELDVNLSCRPQLMEYTAIADAVAADHPGLVLDWGCGWGQVSAMLIERGLNVKSYDYEGEGAPEAEVPLEKYPEISAFLSAEPVKLPYDDDTFDAVLSCGVLEHVKDPESSLDELLRILKPGGRLHVYKLPNRRSYLEWIARKLGWYYHGKFPFDTLYTVPEARAIAERHGFRVERVDYTNMLPLTAGGEAVNRVASLVWKLNGLLARVPGLKSLATNVEVIAVKPGDAA
jgi:ubiquinone/menaquinone biosynthesis C-methylase UbiE